MSDQRRGGLHGGAVAAEHGDDIELVAHRLLGESPRVARAAGGPQLNVPAARRRVSTTASTAR